MLRIRGTIGDLPVDLTLELDDGDWARLGAQLQAAPTPSAPTAAPVKQNEDLWQNAQDLLRKAGQLNGLELLDQLEGLAGDAGAGKRLLVRLRHSTNVKVASGGDTPALHLGRPFVGASSLAKNVNGNAVTLNERGAYGFFASKVGLVQRGKQLAAVHRDQRVIIAQQFEHLQQGLVGQAFAVAAVADKQLEQAFQRRVVLLARQLLDRQLIGRFVILRVLRQTAFQLGSVRQVRSLAQEGDLRLGPGQRGLVVVALDRVEHGLGFTQLTALSQATCIQDQRGGVGVVLAQQLNKQRFSLADAPFAEQRLSLLQRVRRSRWWHLHMGLQHCPYCRLRLCPGKTVHRFGHP